MAKMKIGVIFGGRSGEHEVSLMSAQSIMAALDRQKYEIVPMGITKEGRWLTAPDSLKLMAGNEQQGLAEDLREDAGPSAPLVPHLSAESENGVDVIFPVLHGPYGEDGTIQGLLELAQVPYVGAGVLGSAAAMDKAMMRVAFTQAGLPITRWILVNRSQWESKPEEVLAASEDQIGYPCFVKPSNLGSSVGISKAKDEETLIAAINTACEFDRRIVIEQAVDQPREIECSVLGNDEPQASLPGEVIPGNEFYDYQDKYYDGRARLIIPADLPPDQIATVQEYAVKAFAAVDCAGMARVDFFITHQGKILVNEINTIPGFTQISMYPKLWEVSGLPYGKLLDRLIELALERHKDRVRQRISL